MWVISILAILGTMSSLITMVNERKKGNEVSTFFFGFILFLFIMNIIIFFI